MQASSSSRIEPGRRLTTGSAQGDLHDVLGDRRGDRPAERGRVLTTTATAIFGSLAGAKAMNQASFRFPARSAAVPVLPAIWTPGTAAGRPVPSLDHVGHHLVSRRGVGRRDRVADHWVLRRWKTIERLGAARGRPGSASGARRRWRSPGRPSRSAAASPRAGTGRSRCGPGRSASSAATAGRWSGCRSRPSRRPGRRSAAPSKAEALHLVGQRRTHRLALAELPAELGEDGVDRVGERGRQGDPAACALAGGVADRDAVLGEGAPVDERRVGASSGRSRAPRPRSPS